MSEALRALKPAEKLEEGQNIASVESSITVRIPVVSYAVWKLNRVDVRPAQSKKERVDIGAIAEAVASHISEDESAVRDFIHTYIDATAHNTRLGIQIEFANAESIRVSCSFARRPGGQVQVSAGRVEE